MHPSFGGASILTMFQLWVQEGAAQTALTESCPRPVSESFLHIGDVVKPFVGDTRVKQVFDPRHLLPGSFGEECVLETPESSPISQP